MRSELCQSPSCWIEHALSTHAPRYTCIRCHQSTYLLQAHISIKRTEQHVHGQNNKCKRLPCSNGTAGRWRKLHIPIDEETHS